MIGKNLKSQRSAQAAYLHIYALGFILTHAFSILGLTLMHASIIVKYS